MKIGLAELLDPKLGLAASGIESFQRNREQILEAAWRGRGIKIPVVRGVPCFLPPELRPDLGDFMQRHAAHFPMDASPPTSKTQAEQAKTNVTFSDKWRRFRNYGLEASHQEFLFEWYCKKLGLATLEDLKAFYSGKRRILEVGPGSGFNTRFMAEHCPGTVVAADISEAAFTTFDNTKHLPNCHVVLADLMNLPFADGMFDFVIADGVLHHTPNTRDAVRALFRKVAPGGQFFFYVYKQMGAARYFCDQHIRGAFSQLSPEECYKACEGITELGRELSKLGMQITLEKPIPILGIPAGTHDVQRLVYYNFLKCFWNDAFDYETNNMVNFDWYHPHNAWQHTEDEVRGWLSELGVRHFAINPANPNGISVLLTKNAE